ncbi:hypothetical protein DD606_25710 [Enterobacter cloacae complex sp. GF14B]|nr:hypothetical protein DD606_25710 [Enterobacter cloacae complex sp. GF14B]
MPRIKGKTHYLMLVKAEDCVKDQISGRSSKVRREGTQEEIKQVQKTKTKTKSKKSQKSKQETTKDPEWTKLERKKKYQELKRSLREVWTTEGESDGKEESEKGNMNVPSHYQKFTI